jgi:hypothetical protein
MLVFLVNSLNDSDLPDIVFDSACFHLIILPMTRMPEKFSELVQIRNNCFDQHRASRIDKLMNPVSDT